MNHIDAALSTLSLPVPIVDVVSIKGVGVSLKREDLIHAEVSGNKLWKLLHNIQDGSVRESGMIITFGGAYSNHIAATAAIGKILNVKTLGIIRGDELADKWRDNPTLKKASDNGMSFRFVSREEYRQKEKLAADLSKEFPDATIVPEGGTNPLAVEGIRHMLDERTREYDILCCAVGTGGTVAGISKFAEAHQKAFGFKIVNDDSLDTKIFQLSGRPNFELIDAADGGYGKVTDENIAFINEFHALHGIKLDPIYTGKMMRRLFALIGNGYFESGTRILAFHTGGLQGIEGVNAKLRQSGRKTIHF